MNNKNILVQAFLKSFDYSTKEQAFLLEKSVPVINESIDKKVYIQYVDQWLKNCPSCNISAEDYTIECYDRATTAIQGLLRENIDNDTLLVCTNKEHPALTSILHEFKNVYVMNYDTEIISENLVFIKNEIKKYKKVVIYCIGTTAEGFITPNYFLCQLKEFLENNNVEHLLILDDCQGMFFVPRDYSIFDHIIYTCHVYLRDFDMGIVLSKNNKIHTDVKAVTNLIHFLKCTDLLMNNYLKASYLMKNICQMYFEDYFSKGMLRLPKYYSINTIWCCQVPNFKIDKETFKKVETELKTYEVNITKPSQDRIPYVYIHCRCFQYLTMPNLFLPALKAIENTIKTYQKL